MIFYHNIFYSMSISVALKTLQLGYLTSRKQPESLPEIQINESTSNDFTYRTYSNKNSSPTIILLHGLTRKGYNDHRLIAFAKALAKIGYKVITPNLTFLQNLDFNYSDVETIIKVVQHSCNQSNGKVGIMGFSFGGTYGLLAAGDERINRNLSFVLAGGAYYKLSNLLFNSLNNKRDEFSPAKPYAKLSLLWKYQDKLDLTNDKLSMYRYIMNNYCELENRFSADEIDFIQQLINSPVCDKIVELWNSEKDRLKLLELSGNELTKNISAKIFLLHSKTDEDIPAEETISVYNELVKNKIQPVVHITNDSGHVDFSKRNNIGLFSFFYNIFKMAEECLS